MEVLEEMRRQFDALLEEAVHKDHYNGVKRLLRHQFVRDWKNDKSICSSQSSILPIILAVEKKNFRIIKLFHDYQYTIPDCHMTECACRLCSSDTLGRTLSRLLTLKTLSDPVWLYLSSTDPFLTLFKVSEASRNLAFYNDSFQKSYDEIQSENEKLCLHLLNEIRTQEEGAAIMRYKAHANDPGSALSFINVAIEYKQKEEVAHPVIQHFLTSAVFDDIPHWKRRGIVYKAFVVVVIALLYPITTLLNIICPCQNTCRCLGLGHIALKPFVKFINGAASFSTFLLFLGYLGSSDRSGLRDGTSPVYIEIVIFIWLVGFCVGEIKQVYRSGITAYFSNGWNWVDIGMDTLMLLAFVIWGVLSYFPTSSMVNTLACHLADGAFVTAIVLSFFRILYLCQITRYLGLLQLCLGEMLMVILQFAFICIIVLTAFTVGMIFLFHASTSGALIKSELHAKHNNHTKIYEILSENFNGFWSTMVTMMYVSLTMQGREILHVFADGTLVHLWANILFIIYFGITIIVVLNMLIALMNNSYDKIAQNLTRELMYSRTNIWLEYVGNEQERPVPFNLIPRAATVVRLVQSAFRWFMCAGTEEESEENRVEDDMYTKACNVLMERFLRKTYGECAVQDDSENDYEKNGCAGDHNDAFLRKIDDYVDMWTFNRQILGSDNSNDLQKVNIYPEFSPPSPKTPSPVCL